MNLERLQEYAEARDEIEEIAQRILDVKLAEGHIESEVPIYLEDVDLVQLEFGVVRIRYVEYWAQSGDERASIDVAAQEFCDPKYLLDLYEET